MWFIHNVSPLGPVVRTDKMAIVDLVKDLEDAKKRVALLKPKIVGELLIMDLENVISLEQLLRVEPEAARTSEDSRQRYAVVVRYA